MKKKVTAVILSLILASGSMGIIQVQAADTTGQEAAAEAMEAGNAAASGSCGEHVKWTLTGAGNNLTLTFSGSGSMEDLREEDIPWASNRDKIKKVVVEDGITSVGDFACYSLSGLTDVSLPDSLTSIGKDAFEKCETLESIKIPENVTEIGCRAFSECSSLTSVNIPYGVTCIEEGVFDVCWNLRGINIPESVTCIRDDAFAGCDNLSSITIPESVVSIGYLAFDSIYLERINISDWEKWYNIEFDTYPGMKGNLYINGKKLTEAVIPDGTTEIKSGPLTGITSIKKVTIPDSVRSIGDFAFSGCESLTDISIPEGVERIGDDAFSSCYSLAGIIIPENVKSIGENTFSGCGSLADVSIPEGVESIGDYAFFSCSSLANISIPKSVKSIGECAFFGCVSLTSVTIPEGVKSIGEDAFNACTALKSVTIPDSVTSLGNGVFSRYWEDVIGFIVFTHNPYVKKYCRSNSFLYFDKTAPSIAKITSYNGSDLHVYFDKTEEDAQDIEVASGWANVLGYQIKYADNKNMTGAKSIITEDRNASSKVITGLQNGKTYYVQIQHYMKMDEGTYWSRWSKIKSVTVGQDPYPAHIEKLSAFNGSSIKVDWPKTAGASGYHIKYADNSSMTGAKEVFVKGNSTFTKTLTGLQNGKTYYVKIQTYRTVSGKTYWSHWSEAKSIKVDQSPCGSSIKDLTRLTDTELEVTWDKAPGASGYHIQYQCYDLDGNLVEKEIFVNGDGTLSTTINAKNYNCDYRVRIQTFKKTSGKTYWSSWSEWKEFNVMP